MESSNEKSKNILIVILLIAIILLVGIIFFVIFNKDKENNNIVDNDQQINNEIDSEKITQVELEKIIEEELDILKGKTGLEKITNQNKLSLALKVLRKEKNISDSQILETFTKEELESAFNETSISKLGINHENIIASKSESMDGNPYCGYTYENGVYGNRVSTNSGFTSSTLLSKKVISFEEKDNKYTISIKYLYSSLGETLIDRNELYGKNNEKIGEIPSDVLEKGEVEVRSWADKNFNSFHDKLDTYNYVFEKNNDKIDLVNFYIN